MIYSSLYCDLDKKGLWCKIHMRKVDTAELGRKCFANAYGRAIIEKHLLLIFGLKVFLNSTLIILFQRARRVYIGKFIFLMQN